MKRIANLSLLLTLAWLLGSCGPLPPHLTATEFPSPPPIMPALTPEPLWTPSAAPLPPSSPSSIPTVPPTATFTAIPTFTPTGTPGADAAISLTEVQDNSISLDKLPRGTLYATIQISNEAGTEADVSLHCTTIHNLETVLEYNHVKHIAIQAPQGKYVYVIYVGSRMLSGSFSLLTSQRISLTIYKDRVVLQ